MALFKNMELGKIEKIEEKVPYSQNAINSIMIALKNDLNMTIFSFDKDEMISEHTAPADAMIYVLDGELDISINKVSHVVKKGEMILMPANIPHALSANEKSKMLLIIVKKRNEKEGLINLEYSAVKPFKDILEILKGGVVSKRIFRSQGISSLLFAISENEEIENNQVEGETFILVLDGELNIKIGDENYHPLENEAVIIPSNELYELSSAKDSKFLLIELENN